MPFTKLILTVLLIGCLAGCTTSGRPEIANEPETFRVGEVEVRLYQNRERMVLHLPPLFALLEATRVGNRQIQVSGYFDPRTKTIYAINDAKTVIHEFKHYLEPHWKHRHDAAPADRQTQLSHHLTGPTEADAVID